MNGTEPFGRIYELQNQAITASDTIITVGSVATIQIRSGIVEIVEMFINENWVPLYMNNEVKGDMYYILSEYTDTGCLLSICNIPVPDIIVRINNELQVTTVFRHYNLDGPKPLPEPLPEPLPVPLPEENNEITDYQLQIAKLQAQPVNASQIVCDENNVVIVNVISGTVDTVDIDINGIMTRIGTTSETDNGIYYTVSDYTENGCMLYIYNVYESIIELCINDIFRMNALNRYAGFHVRNED